MAEDMSAMAARLAGVKAAEVEADLPENQQLVRERKETSAKLRPPVEPPLVQPPI